MGSIIIIGELRELRSDRAGQRLAVYAGTDRDGNPAGLVWVWLSDLSDDEYRILESAQPGETVRLRVNFGWSQQEDGSYRPTFRATATLPNPADRPNGPTPRRGTRGEGGAPTPRPQQPQRQQSSRPDRNRDRRR